MGVDTKIRLSEIHKTENLLFSTRVNEYWKRLEIKPNNRPLKYYLNGDNEYSLGQLKTDEYFDYSSVNSIPIIDQSKDLIVGYTDEKELMYNGKLPIIVFGDHTRNFKYIDFPFVQGADGIKVLYPDSRKVNPLFFYYLLNSIGVPSRGYNRHFSLLSIQRYPLIEINKQNEIIEQIQPLEDEIIKLKNSKLKSLEIINNVFGEEFEIDSNYYKEFGKGMTAGTQNSNIKEKLVYKVAFSQIQKSNIVRVSSRFHNPKTQFLNDILFSKPIIKVKDIVSEKVHRGASPNYNIDGEIPVVKTAHLKNGSINISEDEFVSSETYIKSERSQIFENDVLIASTGKVSLGRVDLVETDQELVVDGHISIIRVNDNKYNSQFLTYFLRSIFGVYQIERDYTGATNQIELYSSEIENFDIPDFTLDKQLEIVQKIKTQIDLQNNIDQQIEEKQEQINEIIENAIKTI